MGSIDLFVVGAMKAATTSMCDWLGEQPGVAVSQPKEPAIFVSEESVHELAPRVDSFFAHAAPGAIRVDGSTDYAKFPAIAGVPERVRRSCPQARIVYLMRHPVERAISQYRFEWYLGADRLPFEEAVEANPQLVDNGRYALQLREWLQWFPAEQITLVLSEAFTHDPAAQVARVLEPFSRGSRSVHTPESARTNDTALLVRRSPRARALRRSALGRAVRPLVPTSLVSRHKARQDARSRPDVSAAARRELEARFDLDLLDLARLTDGPAVSCATWDDVVPRWTPELTTA